MSASINHSNQIAANAELHQMRYVDQDIYRVVCIINFFIRRIFNTVKMHGALLHNTISKFLGPTLWHKPVRKCMCKTESFAWSFDFPNNGNSNSLTDCFAEVHPSESLQDKRLKALWVLPPTAPAPDPGRSTSTCYTPQRAKKSRTRDTAARLTSALHKPGTRHRLHSFTRCARNLQTHTHQNHSGATAARFAIIAEQQEYTTSHSSTSPHW